MISLWNDPQAGGRRNPAQGAGDPVDFGAGRRIAAGSDAAVQRLGRLFREIDAEVGTGLALVVVNDHLVAIARLRVAARQIVVRPDRLEGWPGQAPTRLFRNVI
jgi:hypothetical protein